MEAPEPTVLTHFRSGSSEDGDFIEIEFEGERPQRYALADAEALAEGCMAAGLDQVASAVMHLAAGLRAQDHPQ